MSTRSRIGIERLDGRIESIYCHNDGYLGWTGKILFESYNSQDKVEELLRLGNLSFLDEKIEPSNDEMHTFEEPQDKVVIAYHRDRGNENQEAIVSCDLYQFSKLCNESWSNYGYLYSETTQSWKWADSRMLGSISYADLQSTLENMKIIEPQTLCDPKYHSAFIGVLKSNRSIQGMHCLYDGFPEWTGKVLLENYQDEDKIHSLTSKGNIASLEHINRQNKAVIGNHNFSNIEALSKHCKNEYIDYMYLYHDQDNKWFLYERQNEQAVTVEPLQQHLEGINIIGIGKIDERTGINPVTYPQKLYEKYSDYFGSQEAVYTLMHRMRKEASMESNLIGYANVCFIVDEHCDGHEMIHDYVLLLQGRIDTDRFNYIYDEFMEELELQEDSVIQQSMSQ